MLVLKEFRIDENAETFINIKGREEGILSWLLSMIGLDPIVEMQCNRMGILYRSSSARKGQLNITIPNSAVTGVVAGYNKPFFLLVFAAIFIIGGFFFGGFSYGRGSGMFRILGLIIGIALIVTYMLKKNLIFGVYNGGDKLVAHLIVKRSVIEGIAVDFDKFEKAAALLNKVILESSVSRKISN